MMSNPQWRRRSTDSQDAREGVTGARRSFLETKHIKEYARKAIIPVVAFLLLSVSLVSLKWALGISAIEDYLYKIQQELSASEDTIFSYKWDFELEELDGERQILKRVGEHSHPASILGESDFIKSINREDLEEEDVAELIRASAKLRSSVQRNFYFSASDDAEVTLYYEVTCDSSGLRPIPAIAYDLKVNGILLPKMGDWRGKVGLNEQLHNSNGMVQTDSSYVLKMHILSIDMFPPPNVGEAHKGMGMAKSILSGISRCAFSSLIFVRDTPAKFVQDDLMTWVQSRFWK